MKKAKFLFSTVALAAVVLSACKTDGYDTTESGLRYKMHVKKEGVKPKEGDILTMNMIYKRAADDSVIFDTYKSGTPVRVPLQKSTFKGGLEEGFAMLSPGDSATFRVSADSVFLKTFQAQELPPFIPKGSELLFTVKLEKVQSREEVEQEFRQQQEAAIKAAEERKDKEPAEIQDYVTKNNISAKPTASGIYVMVNTPGTGKQAANGNTVVVNYTGRLLDGKVFDTSLEAAAKQANVYNKDRKYEPFEFKLGENSVIPGWEEAIRTMKVGGKSTFIIPSAMAYGPQGAGTVIPPYSPLVFEVELIAIK
jgi:FKBP-type peptidyl-prolyl cis-trans isomerase FkpA